VKGQIPADPSIMYCMNVLPGWLKGPLQKQTSAHPNQQL